MVAMTEVFRVYLARGYFCPPTIRGMSCKDFYGATVRTQVKCYLRLSPPSSQLPLLALEESPIHRGLNTCCRFKDPEEG